MSNFFIFFANATASPPNSNLGSEVLLVLFGAMLGFAFSILTTIITNAMQEKGKIYIYTKIVHSKVGNHQTWGAKKSSDGGLTFHVPLWVEILNKSNVPRVLRDFDLILFNNGIEIKRMTQINKAGEENLGIDGSYSFVINPRSISKIDCLFIVKKKDLPENAVFDEIKVSYYDIKGNQKLSHLKSLSDCWSMDARSKDNQWIMLR